MFCITNLFIFNVSEIKKNNFVNVEKKVLQSKGRCNIILTQPR